MGRTPAAAQKPRAAGAFPDHGLIDSKWQPHRAGPKLKQQFVIREEHVAEQAIQTFSQEITWWNSPRTSI